MSILRRYKSDFTVYFITNVTYQRKPILVGNADLLMNAIDSYRDIIEILAYVILPDHFHMLIDIRGKDISNIMQKIKMSFGVQYRIRMNIDSGRAWQHRFWDHAIRNQNDLNNHIDYIHYNPVKHGHSKSPFKWKHSSIHDYMEQGLYASDWGENDRMFTGEFGE